MLLYKPWGETRYSSGSTPTSYRFTGQREDVTIGLYFYNNRYYDPMLGRFTQADTIVPNPGNPQSLNRYAYVLNNPLAYTDPTGHFTDKELLQWGVFVGPHQLESVRDEPAISFWYYLLRAAEFGDKLAIFNFGAAAESGWVTGEFKVAEEQLVFAVGGSDYRVRWEGFQGGENAGQYLPHEWRLTKPGSQTYSWEQQLRKYVNGPNSLTDPDYYEGTLGGYYGLGGNVTAKWDRFKKWHFGIQAGVGFGKLGFSLTAGKLLQDSTADPGQISLAVDGWGLGFQGGYGVGGALPIVNEGPQPVQFGVSTPGISFAGGYTWPWPIGR